MVAEGDKPEIYIGYVQRLREVPDLADTRRHGLGDRRTRWRRDSAGIKENQSHRQNEEARNLTAKTQKSDEYHCGKE